MVNQQFICLRKVNVLNSKYFQSKIKSPVMIYADFESILVPEDNEKQNPNESYNNKHQKHVACSYGYNYVLMINLVSLLNHTWAKILLKILLIV